MTDDSSDKNLHGEEGGESKGAPDSGRESDRGGTVEGPGPKGSGGFPLRPEADSSEGTASSECERPEMDPPVGGGVYGPGGIP